MTAAASTAEAPAGADAPRARRDLEITDPAHEGGRFVVHDPRSGRYLQLGHSAAEVLRALDGRRSLGDIADGLGAPVDQLAGAVALFGEHGLLESETRPDRPPRRDGLVNELDAGRSRVHRTGLLSVQVDLLDPSRLLDRGGRVVRALTGPAFWATAALALVLGVIGALVNAGRLEHAVSAPLAPVTAVLALLALLPTIAAHELAHASIAWRAGARARRMGVMLLYLMPSMFCDVSDCWRLPRRLDRVRVAAAGIALQVIASGLALGLALIPGLPPGVVTGLLLYAAANTLLAAVNLLPLVRLDGYLMLMSALDITHLRAKAIADARALGAHLVLGQPLREPVLRRRGPVVAFGAACAVAPLAIGAYGLTRVHALLVPLGALGALAWLVVLGLIALALARRGARALRPHLTTGNRRAILRGGLALAALAGALLAIGTSISRPRTIAGAFQRQGATVRLVLPAGLARAVAPGERVLLREPGLLASTRVGTATIAAGRPATLGRLATPSAIEGFGGVGPRDGLALRLGGPPGPASGSAVVQVGQGSLLGSLEATYLTSAWALL